MKNTTTLTALESQVLEELFCSASGNGHDFGFIEDAGIDPKQARGVVASLAKKGIIQIWDPVTNECGTFTQFTWKHLPDGQYPNKVEDILPDNTDVVFPTNPVNIITTMSNQSNTNNTDNNTMDNNTITSLTKAIKEILVSQNGIATTKEVLSVLQVSYPNVKASYRPVFGTLRRLGALVGKASQEVAQVAEAQVEAKVEEAKAEVAALEAEVAKPARRRNAKGHFIKE